MRQVENKDGINLCCAVQIGYAESKVYVNLSQKSIKYSREYDPTFLTKTY